MKDLRPNERHLQGLAGVFAACSQLALRGHNPCFPGVDYGFDIVLDTGVRLQVKTSMLYMGHPAYPDGAYRFSIRENQPIRKGQILQRRPRRNWAGLIDFFVFWGVEENRFFVVPVSQMIAGTIYVRRRREAEFVIRTKVTELKKLGKTNIQIAAELGISPKWVPWLTHPAKKSEKFLTFENNWAALDSDTVAQVAIESVETDILKRV